MHVFIVAGALIHEHTPMAPTKTRPFKVAPSAWADCVRKNWTVASEFGVEVRHGARGTFFPLGHNIAKVEIEPKEGEEPGKEDAAGYAQTLYARANEYRDKEDILIDSQIVVYGRTKDGLQRIACEGKGGRLTGQGQEDVPDSEAGGFVMVWKAAREERKSLVDSVNELAKTVVKLAQAQEGLLQQCADVMKEGVKGRVAEAEATASAYRADRAAQTAENLIEKWSAPLQTWASARYQESMHKRRYAPTGDAVLDAFRDLAEVVDLATANSFLEQLGKEVWDPLAQALGQPEMFTRDEVIAFWKANVRGQISETDWRKLLAAIPSLARERLTKLAEMVQATEG